MITFWPPSSMQIMSTSICVPRHSSSLTPSADEGGTESPRAARRARRPHALQSSTPPMRRHIGVFSEAHLEQTLLLSVEAVSERGAGGGRGGAPESSDVVEAEVEGDELRRWWWWWWDP